MSEKEIRKLIRFMVNEYLENSYIEKVAKIKFYTYIFRISLSLVIAFIGVIYLFTIFK